MKIQLLLYSSIPRINSKVLGSSNQLVPHSSLLLSIMPLVLVNKERDFLERLIDVILNGSCSFEILGHERVKLFRSIFLKF